MTTSHVQSMLGLRFRPIAVAFRSEVPDDVPRWTGDRVPAGCTFWRRAAEGETFCTLPSDHYDCAVGCHTHSIALPEERVSDLERAVRLMTSVRYVSAEEIPHIPTLAQSPRAILYGPADPPSFEPDVVLVAVRPDQAMFLEEACIRAGAVTLAAQVLGRPACAVLPLTVRSRAASFSLGCAGNRMFSGVQADEVWLAVPGARWDAVAEALADVLVANETMERHYEERLRRHWL